MMKVNPKDTMKQLAVITMWLVGALAAVASPVMDLKQSKVTQVVNDVQIISAASEKQTAAAVNDIFSMPDLLRTGAASRAELVAPDETVTRVGANTIFSFDPANRSLDLKQGSLLFHAAHGKGGGTIRTGSATASVLGTTLIVTTTRNGGFKVLALEGQVEVKFPNGRKQKLKPGQMTFVLPGANQMAPVVIFRLDELIQHSLLVHGFSKPLASLALIQDESDLQLELLAAGQLLDTGLYAGDHATPDQVEVLDVNTIAHQRQVDSSVPSPAADLTGAETADATINQPSLTGATIPTPPNHVFLGISFIIPNAFYFPDQGFSGFLARNIFVNTLGGLAGSPGTPLNVDLSHYASVAAFNIVAMNNFSFIGSASFQGLSTANDLELNAGNQFYFTPGISVSASVNNFGISSPATLTLNNVGLYNLAENLSLNSAGDISLQDHSTVSAVGVLDVNAVNDLTVTASHLIGDTTLLSSLTGTLTLDTVTLDAGSKATLVAPTAINLDQTVINSPAVTFLGTGSAGLAINNSTINASSSLVANCVGDLDFTGNTASAGVRSPRLITSGSALITDPAVGSVSLASSAGSVNLSGTSITAHYLTLNSGDGILLNASGQTLSASGSGATANFTAPNHITVSHADFSPFAAVNLAANTINLDNVSFGAGSRVTLKSLLGLLNVGSSVPGYVNFIQNVTYGGNPAQNYIGSGITVTRN